MGQEFEDQADDRLEEVRGDESLHDDAVALRVSLDGTMLRMPAEERDGQVYEQGWREAACGVVAPLDSEGTMLTQRTFARLPEPGKTGLKRQISQEVWHGMPQAAGQDRELKSVAIADGARDNWTFLESLSPDIRLVDVWHACPSLKAAVDAADGAESGKSTTGFDTHTAILTDDPHCVGQVIDALRDLRRKSPGAGEITTAIGSVRSHRQRMRDREARDAGSPIGSDPKEAAHTMIVNTRLKRSGQRWGRAGGQGVITVRARLKSRRFDNVWAQLTHRRRHAQAHLAANDNRTPLARVA